MLAPTWAGSWLTGVDRPSSRAARSRPESSTVLVVVPTPQLACTPATPPAADGYRHGIPTTITRPLIHAAAYYIARPQHATSIRTRIRPLLRCLRLSRLSHSSILSLPHYPSPATRAVCRGLLHLMYPIPWARPWKCSIRSAGERARRRLALLSINQIAGSSNVYLSNAKNSCQTSVPGHQ